MAYRYLDEFDGDAHVEAEKAKHDKIELNIGTWMFDGDTTTIDQIATRLSQAVNFYRDGNGRRYRFRIFNRGVRGRYQRVIKFAATGEPHFPIGRPLIQGRIKFRRDTASTTCYIDTELTINPTRALAQTGPRSILQANIEDHDYTSAMFRQRALPRSSEEFSLRASDNYIWDSRLIRSMRDERWMQFVSSYLHGVDQFLQNRIANTFEAEGIELHRSHDYNLKKVEAYWEFQHRDPIWLMHQLTPTFLALGKAGHLVEYATGDGNELFPRAEINQNSPLLRSQITSDITIKVYAKTNRRVRFEVERKSGRLRHTSHSLNDIIGMIEDYTEDAAGRMNQALTNLIEAIGNDVEQSPPYELVQEIFNATDDATERRLLLSELVVRGGYTKVHRQPINDAVDRLHDREVIRRTAPRAPSFLLVQRFQRARSILSGNLDELFDQR